MASLGSDGTGKLDVVVLKKLNDDMEKLQQICWNPSRRQKISPSS